MSTFFKWWNAHAFYALMVIAALQVSLLVTDAPGTWTYYNAGVAVICVLTGLWFGMPE